MRPGEAQPSQRPVKFSMPGALHPAQRASDLRRMAEQTLDVLVVGGGVVGAGSALDAAARGLSVGLVERDDFASGTSSRSSRLAHGGLRYLEQGRLGLVSEALAERHRLVHDLCPHLARPVSFLLPLRRPIIDRLYLGAGIRLYDLLAMRGGRGLGRARHLSRAAALERFPLLQTERLRGALMYEDAQIDDARHTLALARTAAAQGAAVVSGVACEGLTREGDIQRVALHDRDTDERIEVRARWVVVAAGPWAEKVGQKIGSTPISLTTSKGVHLVVPRERIPGDAALISRTRTSVLLILPWHGHWLIGTTDTAWDLPPDVPLASQKDIDYLLGEANRVLSRPIGRDDISGVYAGLRPLVKAAGSMAKISREHVVSTVPGLVFVGGGKYTTYRVMAADAIDPVARALGAGPGTTEELPLLGADGLDGAGSELTPTHGAVEAERLVRRYGGEARVLSPSVGASIEGANGLRRGEVAWACTVEGARHLDDLMRHRTRISIETPDGGLSAAAAIAGEMAAHLAWDAPRREAEMAAFAESVAGERAAGYAADDSAAAEAYGAAV